MWEMVPLSKVCLLALDCVNKTAKLADQETPYRMLRTTNVKSGFIDFEQVRYVSEETFKIWTRRAQPQYGDVLFTREAPVGEVGRFTAKEGNYFLGQRLFLYRPNPEFLDWNYLAYCLQSELIQGWIQGIAFGATVPHIKVGDAEHLEIPLPPIKIQRKIGTVLSAYDDLIEANLKRIKLLEEMAQITYEEWFVRLRFPNHETTPINPKTGLPEGWVKAKFKSLMTLNYGKSLTADNRVDGNIPVYGSSGIVGFHNQALVNGSGLILGRKGNVGSVFFSEVPFYAIDTVYFITSKIPLRFLYYVLTSAHFINNDAAVPGLNRDAAYAKETVLPTPDAIDRFNQFLVPHFQLAEKLRLQNTLLKEARDLLLPRLMTGMIDIDDYLARSREAAVAA